MRVWIICTVLLLTMLAVLESMYMVSIPILNAHTLWVLLAISLFCLALSRTLPRTLKRLQVKDYPSIIHSSSTSPALQFKTRGYFKPDCFICFICQNGFMLLGIMGLWLATVLQVLIVHQQTLNKQLSQPQRVVATVKILGISDSINHQGVMPQTDLQTNQKSAQQTSMGYRQLAQIEYAQPLQTTSLNGSYWNTQNKGLDELQGMRVLLSAFAGNEEFDVNALQPNQRVTMTLQLTPVPNKNVTNMEFDVHRWLRSRHINAQAKVLSVLDVNNLSFDKQQSVNQSHTLLPFASFKNLLDSQRFKMRQHFLSDWEDKTLAQQQASAVTLSLLTGDRALINKSSKDLYQWAGISHLLAISGTHVLFLAIMVSMLGVGLLNKILPTVYKIIPRWLVRWVLMVVVATLYAFFTGFDVPAARTLWMLICVGLMRVLLVKSTSQQILLMVAVVMAWADPYVLWQAGFWLSFMAVMLLISFEQNSANMSFSNINTHDNKPLAFGITTDKNSGSGHHSIRQWLWQGTLYSRFIDTVANLVKLQLWMFVTLLPLSLLLFGKVSWWGLPINLFAIGLYGWLLVPINLIAGVLYPVLPNVADGLWMLVSHILQLVHGLLTQLSQFQDSHTGAWIYNQIPAGMIVVFALAGLPWMLPKGLLSRLFSIPPMLLAVIMLYNQVYATNQQISFTVVTHKDAYLSSHLLQAGDDNWLIVTDYLPASSYYKRHITQKKLAQFWQEIMGKNGVNHLTGLIIQTPSALLTDAAMQLSENMPVGQMWQAGLNNNVDYGADSIFSPNLKNRSNNVILNPCQVGKHWQNQQHTIRISAITGWQNLNAKTADEASALKNCVIEITANKKIVINMTQPVPWVANNTDFTITDTSSILANTQPKQSLPLVNRLLIDTATSHKTWQMWQLMCQYEDIATKSLQVKSLQDSYANNAQQATMMLSHSSSALTQVDIIQQQSAYLLLNNIVNKYNQTATRQKLLEHQQSIIGLH